MTTPRSRLRQRLLAAVSAGALAIGALSLVAGPTQAAPAPVPATTSGSGNPSYVQDATFVWGVSGYAQKGIFGPWTFKEQTGNATLLNGATQTEYQVSPVPATSMPAAGGAVPTNPNAVKFSAGSGVVNTSTGAGKLSWTGSYTINAYPANFNAPNEIYTDPILTIAADGSGSLTAGFKIGAGTDQGGNPFPETNFGRLTVADFAAGSLSDKTATGYRATPKYQGVEVTAPAGLAAQDRTCTATGGATGWWGAWPQAFLNAIGSTEAGKSVSPHFYSTGCGGMQDNKPQLPIDVKYSVTPPKVTVSNTRVNAAGGTTITVSGTGFHAPLAVAGRAPVGAGTEGAGAYVVFGKFAENWRPSTVPAPPSSNRKQATVASGGQKWAIPAPHYGKPGLTPASGAILMAPDGSFSTDLVLDKSALDTVAGAGTDDFRYGIYTYAGSGAITPSYETFTPVKFLPVASTIALDEDTYSGTAGDAIPVEVTVSGPNEPEKATGTVNLSVTVEGNGPPVQVASGTLANGKVTLNLPASLAAGEGGITVDYLGDEIYSPSTKESGYTIVKHVPTVELDQANYAGPAGTAIPVKVTVKGVDGKPTPTGSVQLTYQHQGDVGATPLAPVDLVDGKATPELPSTLSLGTGVIGVNYSGDGLYGSPLKTATYEIGKNAVSVQLAESYSGNAGAALPVAVTVAGANAGLTPTGKVTLKYQPTGGDLVTLPEVNLVDAKATVNLPATLAAGSGGSLTVAYSGDDTHATNSASAPYAINKNNTSITLAAKYTGTAGAAVPVAVTVNTPAGQPKAAGPVTLKYTPEGGAQQSVAPVNLDAAGKATVNLPANLAVGTGALAVSYAGNPQNNASTAGSAYEITKVTATVQLEDSYAGAAGAEVPVAVTVSGPAGTPTGAVKLTYQPTGGAAQELAATLAGGKATFTLPDTLAAGSNGAIEVAYAGSSTYTAATASATYTIAAKVATTVALDKESYTGTAGTAVPVAITVSSAAGTPTGKVALTWTPDGGSASTAIEADLVAGKATISLPASVTAGSGDLTVAYAGSTTHAAAGKTAPYTLAKKSSGLSVKGPDKVAYRTKATYVVTVSGGATGKVKVTGANVTYLRPIEDGQATFVLPATLSAGPRTLKFTYDGDDNTSVAKEATKKITIAKGAVSVAAKVTSKWAADQSGKFRVTITSVKGGPVPVGKVSLTLKKGKVTKKVKAKYLADGKVVFKLPKSSKGTWKVTASYAGTSQHAAVKKAWKVKVKAS